MSTRLDRQWVVWFWFLTTIVHGAAAALRADVVHLQSGATLHGRVLPASTGGSKNIAVRASSGGTIVFDRAEVKRVERVADPATKAATAKAQRESQQLTAEERAWIPKVRSLVGRINSDDGEKSRRARSDLSKIEDPDAIPALQKFMSSHPDDDVRGLFVSTLRYIAGSKPVVALVNQSLTDPSARVRSAAFEAIGEKRKPIARTYYTMALRSGSAELIQRAAEALNEIGDPEYASVAALIDSLSYAVTFKVMTSQGTVAVDPSISQTFGPPPADHYSTKGPKLGEDYGRWYLGKEPPQSSMWGALSHPTSRMIPGGSPGSTPLPDKFIETDHVWSKPVPQTSVSGDTRSCAPKFSDRVSQEFRPSVYDSLRSITGKDFKLDRKAWRDWLTTEEKNRELRESPVDKAAR